MHLRVWLKRLAPVLVLVVAAATYGLLERAPQSTRSPVVATEGPTEESLDFGRSSEQFRIVEDAAEGDVAAALGDLSPSQAAAQTESPSNDQPQVITNATVIKVADGDTFDVRFDTGETATIRMLGVNTPETVDPRKAVECFGKEASDFTKATLHDARVRLDADAQADERDKYGRLLRNVTLADGTDFNARLVSDGYAYAYLSFPLDPVRKKQLSDLEKEAKDAKRGLWGGVCTE